MKVKSIPSPFAVEFAVSDAKHFHFVNPLDPDGDLVLLDQNDPIRIGAAAEALGCPPLLLQAVVENKADLVEQMERDLTDMFGFIARLVKAGGVITPEGIEKLAGGR